MKYSVHDYAKALDEAIADSAAGPVAKKEAVVKNFLTLIRRNNDESRMKKILEEAARLARGRNRGQVGAIRQVTIQSARPLSKAQEKMLAGFLGADDVVDYEIDPELVAGVKIIVNDEMQFDGTMKAKLDNLFGATI
jgi:F0F1-type ATP synthase delta subunit